MAMLGYILAILPLIRQLTFEHPNLKHLWYEDDAVVMGNYKDIKNFFISLREQGKTYGYYPGPRKSEMIVQTILSRERKPFSLKRDLW